MLLPSRTDLFSAPAPLSRLRPPYPEVTESFGRVPLHEFSLASRSSPLPTCVGFLYGLLDIAAFSGWFVWDLSLIRSHLGSFQIILSVPSSWVPFDWSNSCARPSERRVPSWSLGLPIASPFRESHNLSLRSSGHSLSFISLPVVGKIPSMDHHR